MLQELRRVESEIGVTQELVGTLEDQIEERSLEIETTTEELARAGRARDQAPDPARCGACGRSTSSAGGNQILLMADSFAQILGRYKYIRLVAEQDRRPLARIARLETTIRRNRSEL